MRLIFAGCLMVLVFWSSVGSQEPADQRVLTDSMIDARSLWAPPTETLKKIRSACGSLQGQALSDCFITAMKEEGARPEALAFARKIGGLAYMEGFLEAGWVDVAYVVYPFRANENYGWFLVNGSPGLIDVDDPVHRSRAVLEKDTQYRALAKKHPALTVWPGERSPNSVPMMRELRNRAQRFVVGYRMTDGCRTCAYLGMAWIAFDFTKNGTFVGTKFLGIEKTPRQAAPRAPSDTVEQGLTNPLRPVEAKAGERFVIVLGANHTTGYRWEMVGSVDGNILELVGSVYEPSKDEKTGAGGRELWTFAAKSAGKTRISFQYVRPWEKQTGKAKTTSFEIIIR